MEFVYVVPRGELFPDCYPQGFVPFAGAEATCPDEFLGRAREHGYFVEREHAERSPGLKQLIPYTILVREDEDARRVLLLKRTKRGGEARLHDKLSIGVGGHINPEDAAPDRSEVVAQGTRREISEEIEVERLSKITPIGILNDDSNPVGAVHVGIVQIVTVHGEVGIRETDQLEGRMVELGELKELRERGANFETWSALLVDALDRILAPTHASPPAAPASAEPASAR